MTPLELMQWAGAAGVSAVVIGLCVALAVIVVRSALPNKPGK